MTTTLQLPRPTQPRTRSTSEGAPGSAWPIPRRIAREWLVARYRPLAASLARRFRSSGEPIEDLEQVACLGLLKAADRFDPARGVAFAAFAVPTISGELKRHVRDKAWAMRVPRRLQEAGLRLQSARGDLTQRLGRTPTADELAEHTGLEPEEVREGLSAASAYTIPSLDAPRRGHGVVQTDQVGSPDETMELLEEWACVTPLLRELPERERTILYLRFMVGLTQSQIAGRVGISQMHVSRLLARTLEWLRAAAGVEDAAGADEGQRTAS